MRSSHSLERLSVEFSDAHAVADAGLLLPATLAEKLGLRELLDEHVDLGRAPGAANPGVKALTLIYSALAGGDCIDDAAALRAGATTAVLGGELRAPSTLGTFLRAFTWGHALQLDAASRRLLARAWEAGAGPGAAPLTIDLDSTICETYGLQKAGGSRFTYTHVRGYHPLLAVAAGTGEVLHARLRGGPANTTRGAARFISETVSRLRGAGAGGQLTLRADSGFYGAKVVAACRSKGVRFSITVRQHRGLQARFVALPEEAWTAIPYFMPGAAVAEIAYTPFGKKGFPVRLIVRRVPPSPGSQLALFASYSYLRLHLRPRGRDARPRGRPPSPRRDRERDPRPQVWGGPEPSALRQVRRQRRLAGPAGDGPQSRHLGEPSRHPGATAAHEDPQAALPHAAREAHAGGGASAPRAAPRLALAGALPGGACAPARLAAACLSAARSLTITQSWTRPGRGLPASALSGRPGEPQGFAATLVRDLVAG